MGRSYKDIKYDLWYNLEKIGVLPGDILLAIKALPGNKVFSYGYIPKIGSINSVSVEKGSFIFDGSTSYLDFGTAAVFNGLTELTAVTDWELDTGNITATDSVIRKDGACTPIQVSASFNVVRFGLWTPTLTPHEVALSKLKSNQRFKWQTTWSTQANSGAPQLYINGQYDSDYSGNSTSAIVDPGTIELTIGAKEGGAGEHFNGQIYNSLIIKKRCNNGRISSLAFDPYKPRPDISYFDQATQTSLLPNKLSVTVAGYSATISTGTEISATLGTATASGLTPSVSLGRTISVVTGQATAAAINPTVGLGNTISAASGSATAAAINPAVSLGKTVTSGIGTATTTGINPTIQTGSGINCTTGSVSVQAVNPTVSKGLTFSATLGHVTAAGYQATISNDNTISCTAGAVVAAGLSPGVALSKSISCSLGTVTVGGQTPAVANGTAVGSGLGQIAATAINPGVTHTLLIEPTTGTIILTGVNPSVSTGAIPETPTSRTYAIASESRVYSIDTETRVYSIT